MRIGGGIVKEYRNPDEWLKQVKELNYSAVLTPVDQDATAQVKADYLDCIKRNDLVIGEVGIWRNPISLNEEEAGKNKEYAKERLALAEELGANCCVNIAGSRGEIWDGFYEENYHDDVYTLIVDTTREIIDSVNPKRTFFTLEPMPWMLPDSPDTYLKLIEDIDRRSFAVHLDFTNMISNPRRFLFRDAFIEECFQKLGPFIKSIHAKDCIMEQAYPCSIKELMPGKGRIDFRKVVRLCENLGPDTTVFVEHLNTHVEYREAAAYLRSCAENQGIKVK